MDLPKDFGAPDKTFPRIAIGPFGSRYPNSLGRASLAAASHWLVQLISIRLALGAVVAVSVALAFGVFDA
jgi:hypothetical protein